MGKITLKTLAAKLKLSMSTVSKALNDSHEISGETKRKVRLMANKMHFVPNPYASSLRKKISKTIAIVIPEVSDSFFAQAINGIESVLQDKGYHVLIYLTHEKFRKENPSSRKYRMAGSMGYLCLFRQKQRVICT